MMSTSFAIFLTAFITITQLLGSLGGSDDGPAMWELARSLTGAPASWRKGSDPCNPLWEGVLCDSGGGVVSLHLSDSSLSGSLPSSFGSLTSLESIHLQQNSISGALPSLAGLTRLREAEFSNNGFSTVPAGFLSSISCNLTALTLSNNPIRPSWSIPAALAICTSLVYFYARNASLGGSITDVFARLSVLQEVTLSDNRLTGEIPASLAALPKLELLDVSRNDLWGRIPNFGSGVTVQLEGNP